MEACCPRQHPEAIGDELNIILSKCGRECGAMTRFILQRSGVYGDRKSRISESLYPRTRGSCSTQEQANWKRTRRDCHLPESVDKRSAVELLSSLPPKRHNRHSHLERRRRRPMEDAFLDCQSRRDDSAFRKQGLYVSDADRRPTFVPCRHCGSDQVQRYRAEIAVHKDRVVALKTELDWLELGIIRWCKANNVGFREFRATLEKLGAKRV